ncbi:MAG: hypothetical protein EAZ08_01290 [Cytophagales bacterium]|nr:MAG: hypothetical protein EAZ08_01290 [Cytophagales bacterium]
MNETLALFYSADLHDAVVKTMSFDFEKQSLHFVFELWDSEKEQTTLYSQEFKGVDKFTSDYPQALKFAPSSCFLHTCKAVENNRYEASYKFDFQDGDVVWLLTIGFTSLSVESEYLRL